ncbi:hypothetical protein M407DRAFT_21760 [Tulasnella calospora MUT 4182]|uniref:Uncharacterized protein n=1 Tax=Tulasnella calospora MUT 4182 TaxID=1051891 RepID=A0A0C3QMQ2_9AGAM|nr:hypothetical protein M407DRAFT_21760 [Tulasnella calospora MUT 4182]
MEDLCIAAPRPLRLFTPVVHRPRPRIVSAPVEAFARFSLSDDPIDDLRPTASSPQSNSSPNPSPATYNDPTIGATHVVYDSSSTRPGLPEETLEEFFAILRPPIFSPPLRVPRRHHSTNATWAYERPHPYRIARKSTSTSSTTTTTDDTDRKSRRGIGRLSRDRSEANTPLTTAIEDHTPSDWLNFELGKFAHFTHAYPQSTSSAPVVRNPHIQPALQRALFPTDTAF